MTSQLDPCVALIAGDIVENRYEVRGRLLDSGSTPSFLAEQVSGAMPRFVRLYPLLRASPRLLDAALALSAIRHPNVCSPFDVGTAGELSFVAVPLVVGEPLTALAVAVRDRPDIARSPRWMWSAAQIVAAAAAGASAIDGRQGDRLPPGWLAPRRISVTYAGETIVAGFEPPRRDNEASGTSSPVRTLGTLLRGLTIECASGGAGTDSARPWVPPELVTIIGRALAVPGTAPFHTPEELSSELHGLIAARRAPPPLARIITDVCRPHREWWRQQLERLGAGELLDIRSRAVPVTASEDAELTIP